MRALAISDTHVNTRVEIPALAAAIEPFVAEVDMILHAGDSVCHEVVEYLRGLGPALHIVAGNMDHPDLRWTLPQQLVIELGVCRVGLAHGRGAPQGLAEGLRPLFDDVAAIVYGHSHEAGIKEIDGVLMVNPGSPTDKRFSDHMTVALLESGSAGGVGLEARIVALD